jgi:oxygen-dependent protoporphyrinogen oxidase
MNAAVIGGGISGLSVAFRLKQAGVGVTLFEATQRVGGNIETVRAGGYLLEHGPNSLLGNRELFELINKLGIANAVQSPRPEAKKRYIVRDGRLTALPAGLADIFTTKALSIRGRVRLLKEPFVGSGSVDDESVASFFERRFGKEVADYAVDPFVSGIYAGDPQRLRIQSAFPKLYRYEQEKGGIIKGALFSPKNKAARLPKNAPRTFSFSDGISTLTDSLRVSLGGSVRCETACKEIRVNEGDSVELITDTSAGTFDAVVISTPADAAARLIATLDDDLSSELGKIYYPPITVVYAAFKKDRVKVEPNGFGVLVPAVEERRILGVLFSSSIFEGRAPDDEHLFTIFIGGSRNAELCAKTEDELIRIATDEVRDLMEITGEPTFTAVKKWERSIPQYNIGYERVPEAIERFRRSHPAIFFCSNFYKGISVGDCIKNSVSTSRDILDYLKK